MAARSAFAPLLVGIGPLSLADWRTIRGMGLIDSFVALVQPVLVSVPALLILDVAVQGAGRAYRQGLPERRGPALTPHGLGIPRAGHPRLEH